jgi:hypothetical protein
MKISGVFEIYLSREMEEGMLDLIWGMAGYRTARLPGGYRIDRRQ